MYTAHFRLTDLPFSITPDPRYLYISERHRDALAHLVYGVRQLGGFVQLTGEVGTGKTTLWRCLLAQLPPDTEIGLILNPRLNTREMLSAVCDELRVSYPPETHSVKVLVDALYRHLLDSHARGRRVVLIIDEAQNLSVAVLEQIRLLTNLETATKKLMQIILIGQPELSRLLDRPQLRQVAQRINARFHLLPLSLRETRAYIRHRLRVAGGSGALLTEAALRGVHRRSGGVPRLINILCDRALLGAYSHRRDRVDITMVRKAGREVRGLLPWGVRRRHVASLFGAGAVGAAAAGLVLLVASGYLPFPRDPGAPTIVATEARPTPVAYASGADAGGRDSSAGGSRGLEARASTGVPVGEPSAPPRLAALLSGPSRRGDQRAAVAVLYARWGASPPGTDGSLGCDAGRAEGLACLGRVGNWTKLRRLDLPAVLTLTTESGERHRVALVALGKETAVLEIGGREHAFPLNEIDQFWDGPFVLLWKPPGVGVRLLTLGMRGPDVEWLRSRLDLFEGKAPSSSSSDVFDAALQQRVQAFQRSRFLLPDGVVGEETLLHLTLVARDPGVPSVSGRTP